MNNVVVKDDIIGVLKDFLKFNDGDECTQDLLISFAAEILGVSSDSLVDYINS